MKLKTNKAIAKRFKVTKNKKVLKRKEGLDHFNAKNTGKQTRNKRGVKKLSDTHKKALKAGLPYVGF